MPLKQLDAHKQNNGLPNSYNRNDDDYDNKKSELMLMGRATASV